MPFTEAALAVIWFYSRWLSQRPYLLSSGLSPGEQGGLVGSVGLEPELVQLKLL